MSSQGCACDRLLNTSGHVECHFSRARERERGGIKGWREGQSQRDKSKTDSAYRRREMDKWIVKRGTEKERGANESQRRGKENTSKDR